MSHANSELLIDSCSSTEHGIALLPRLNWINDIFLFELHQCLFIHFVAGQWQEQRTFCIGWCNFNCECWRTKLIVKAHRTVSTAYKSNPINGLIQSNGYMNMKMRNTCLLIITRGGIVCCKLNITHCAVL